MDRLNVCRLLRFGFDLFTDAPNINIDAARSNRAVITPNAVEQLIAGKKPASQTG